MHQTETLVMRWRCYDTVAIVIFHVRSHFYYLFLSSRIMKDKELVTQHRFFSFVIPGLTTLVLFLLLSPILLRKQPIAETLHSNGDLRFFGDPFPEITVEMKLLRRTPKPSKSWTYEDLIFRNMMARLGNLTKGMFWKLLWKRWICRGCSWGPRDKDTKKSILDWMMIAVWFPVSMILVILHVVPLFSVWANYIRKQMKQSFHCNTKATLLARISAVPLLFMQLFGIFFLCVMMWNLLVIGGQFVVFLFIDIVRNAATTLSKMILFLAVFIYVRRAFQDFEDGYRELKSVTFALCSEKVEAVVDEDTNIVVKLKPFEPLYVKTKDGEASIPRRIFYEVCKVYRPYAKEVTATIISLFITFSLIIIIFALMIRFRIFEQFSQVGETMLTLGTAILPAVLGTLRSSTHQSLSNQRRELHLRTWLDKITTTRKVNLNLNRPTKRDGSPC